MSRLLRRQAETVGARRGQSLVELALLMPVLALILIGTLDLGRAFYQYTQLTNSVQAGALYGHALPHAVTAADSANPENITFQIQNEGSLSIEAADITVRCYASPDEGPLISSTMLRGDGGCSTASGAKSGDIIEITARYRFQPITTQLLAFLPSTYKISKSIRMVIR
jgi:hypothetical protein